MFKSGDGYVVVGDETIDGVDVKIRGISKKFNSQTFCFDTQCS